MREQVGRYRIARKIGRGGMGDVFRAIDPEKGMAVAVKILRPFEALADLVGYDRLEELFISEAETMSFLDHPAIVKVLDSGREEEGRPYFVMEFFCNNLGRLIGESFRGDRKSRCLTPQKVKDYGSQLLEGLEQIHNNRIVHRDIKPFNIMISEEERLRICDFGMALVDEISFAGVEGVQIGSPFYTAPEQELDPVAVDGRADLYSAGVLLYRMLTGELPVAGSEAIAALEPACGGDWRGFFTKALQREPGERFQVAEEMGEALARLPVFDLEEPATGNRSQNPITKPLRKEPVNVCGKEALQVFGLNELHYPENPGEKSRTLQGSGIVWHDKTSDGLLTYVETGEYLDSLNSQRSVGQCNWRLPTVNELLSLSVDPGDSPKPWRSRLWSCDRHGERDAWYVNLEMGFADWQDIACRNYVRAVSDKDG